MDKYMSRGVSSQKEDVHNAVDHLDQGVFPGAFCKVIPDYLSGDSRYCNIMHADGAGTKSSLAYIYYKETGDLSVWSGIAMDSIVMNTDDLICVGVDTPILLSSTIGRNAKLVGGEVIKELINANEEICQFFTDNGVPMYMTGGETADVGDLTRTIIVDTTAVTRIERDKIITCEDVACGDVIVALASFGQATFEKQYNSGMGSNGLTSARHDLLCSEYRTKYPESFDNSMDESISYCGKFKITDTVPELPLNIGKAILSPTRTYAFVIKDILSEYRSKIHGIVHCSGGGQTKCKKFGRNVKYVKDNLFEIPPFFKLIHDTTGTDYREMYQVFNMGHRMELYTDAKTAEQVIAIAAKYNIDAKIVGHVESNENGNAVEITSPNGIIKY